MRVADQESLNEIARLQDEVTRLQDQVVTMTDRAAQSRDSIVTLRDRLRESQARGAELREKIAILEAEREIDQVFLAGVEHGYQGAIGALTEQPSQGEE